MSIVSMGSLSNVTFSKQGCSDPRDFIRRQSESQLICQVNSVQCSAKYLSTPEY